MKNLFHRGIRNNNNQKKLRNLNMSKPELSESETIWIGKVIIKIVEQNLQDGGGLSKLKGSFNGRVDVLMPWLSHCLHSKVQYLKPAQFPITHMKFIYKRETDRKKRVWEIWGNFWEIPSNEDGPIVDREVNAPEERQKTRH